MTQRRYCFAICDDSRRACEANKKKLTEFADENLYFFEIDIFTNPNDLMIKLKEKPYYYDAVLLDIEFTGAKYKYYGIILGKWIRETLDNNLIDIIFVSKYKDLIFRSLVARPFSYIHKSDDDEIVFSEFKRLLKNSDRKGKFFFRYKKEYLQNRIDVQEILYIQLEGRTVRMKTKDGEEVFRDTIKRCYEELSGFDFIKVSQNLIVNYNFIKGYTANKIQLANNRIVKLSSDGFKQLEKIGILRENNNIRYCENMSNDL
ncbi:MAG: LytTR family transcriptional regulator DNA-binding domain-containing protein [Lachnospiraceae bacterium]|jgi:DNA-binding LytR/AlgR family response regulator|nr:LytTR family transcriptional regulator DNA-binding domain-containing protein [Lachnospiraceae bacterium]